MIRDSRRFLYGACIGILAAVVITAGFARGLHEGMVMSMAGDIMHTGALDGVRGHAGFESYHQIGAAAVVLMVIAALLAALWRPRWLVYAGLAILLWEGTEIGYSIARWGMVAAYEHINVMDVVSVRLYGWQVWAMHATRWVAGLTIIQYGGGS